MSIFQYYFKKQVIQEKSKIFLSMITNYELRIMNCILYSTSPNRQRHLINSIDYLNVSRAAAEVAGDGFSDCFPVGFASLLQVVFGGYDHAAGAKTALNGSAFHKRRLQLFSQLICPAQALIGPNLMAGAGRCQSDAGFYRHPV